MTWGWINRRGNSRHQEGKYQDEMHGQERVDLWNWPHDFPPSDPCLIAQQHLLLTWFIFQCRSSFIRGRATEFAELFAELTTVAELLLDSYIYTYVHSYITYLQGKIINFSIQSVTSNVKFHIYQIILESYDLEFNFKVSRLI